jgi:hypothetical protein
LLTFVCFGVFVIQIGIGFNFGFGFGFITYSFVNSYESIIYKTQKFMLKWVNLFICNKQIMKKNIFLS